MTRDLTDLDIAELDKLLGDRLLRVEAPLGRCVTDPGSPAEFARERGIRLVIKGTGHDYLGRASAPESLLIWTHRMREITVHDAFRPAGTDGPGVPAITVGAGTRWLEAYQAATGLGRYVQGGGCVSLRRDRGGERGAARRPVLGPARRGRRHVRRGHQADDAYLSDAGHAQHGTGHDPGQRGRGVPAPAHRTRPVPAEPVQ